uniref:Putative acyl-CoA-binding domain-containing protein 4-like n=1 Tax=Solanum chacoense TaxID=4108 RepID=A0A0V0IFY9_SOLCH
MTWSTVETTQTSPAPRFDHTAALHADRYLLILGGCSHSIFFNDLHVLDLETMEWSQPQLQGDLVSPRAGHAGVTIGDNWYIVGGGDNKSGVPETLMLNMSKLVVSALATVKGRDPLASEGLSVSSASLDGENFLVAFGGYNGKYNNEVYVMRPKPRDVLHPKILQSPAAEAAAASVRAAYALTKPEKLDLSEREDTSFKEVHVDSTQQNLLAEISALGEQKKVLESSLADVRAENVDLRNKIEDVNTTHADLSKELQSVQGQLISERSRCAKLEAQIAELKKMLESMQSIEEEVQALRKEKSEFERNMERVSSVQKQGSGGAWKWITG